jgi:hypothetical protein
MRSSHLVERLMDLTGKSSCTMYRYQEVWKSSVDNSGSARSSKKELTGTITIRLPESTIAWYRETAEGKETPVQSLLRDSLELVKANAEVFGI